MAEEIARYKKVNVRRPEREYLLKVRAGEFSYEDLLEEAEEKIQVIDELFKKSDLPEQPDLQLAEGKLVEIRQSTYPI
jgi:uncharacterized protein